MRAGSPSPTIAVTIDALMGAGLPEWWGSGDDDGKVGHAQRPVERSPPKADQRQDEGALSLYEMWGARMLYRYSLTTRSTVAVVIAARGTSGWRWRLGTW